MFIEEEPGHSWTTALETCLRYDFTLSFDKEIYVDLCRTAFRLLRLCSSNSRPSNHLRLQKNHLPCDYQKITCLATTKKNHLRLFTPNLAYHRSQNALKPSIFPRTGVQITCDYFSVFHNYQITCDYMNLATTRQKSLATRDSFTP